MVCPGWSGTHPADGLRRARGRTVPRRASERSRARARGAQEGARARAGGRRGGGGGGGAERASGARHSPAAARRPAPPQGRPVPGQGAMAFTTRSLRENGAPVESAAGAMVGPGSYLGQEAYKVSQAYAPFASTAGRDMGGASGSRAVPGPGAYASAHGGIAGEVRRRAATASNCFASGVKRFEGPGVEMAAPTPGPGTYAEGNAWVRRAGSTPAAALASPARRMTFRRTPTAPSVPARNQSSGYEEGRNGELVMQRPNMTGHDGTGADSVGPTQYRPNFKALERSRQTNFGASRSSRSAIGVGGGAQDTPGPGAYATQGRGVGGLGGKVGRGADGSAAGGSNSSGEGSVAPDAFEAAQAAQPSSNFASRVPRLSGSGDDGEQRDPGPGPGTYETLKAITLKSAPRAHQFFGSTSKRAYEVDAPSLLSAPMQLKTPGPGQYAERRTSFAPARMGPDAAPFTSTQRRFSMAGTGSNPKALPGPGQYSNDDPRFVSSALSRKVVGRNGAFGTTTDRFISSSNQSNDEAPGPGAYIDSTKLITGEGIRQAAMRKPSAAFASGTIRFNHKPRTENGAEGGAVGSSESLGAPPPGTYEMDDPWKRVGKQRAPARHGGAIFISTQPRFKGAAAVGAGSCGSAAENETPGPGYYSTDGQLSAGARPQLDLRRGPRAGFNSNSGRFKSTNSFTPGPGAYENSRPDQALIRRSYNVTIESM